MKFWIVSDRRTSRIQIYQNLFAGNQRQHLLYLSIDAARSAAYATETIWEIKIQATKRKP